MLEIIKVNMFEIRELRRQGFSYKANRLLDDMKESLQKSRKKKGNGL